MQYCDYVLRDQGGGFDKECTTDKSNAPDDKEKHTSEHTYAASGTSI
jgi:hypothetical protein